MVFVVYSNDMNGHDLITLEQVDEFVTKELIPRLDVPDNYKIMFDGETLYMGSNGGMTFVGTPFQKKN